MNELKSIWDGWEKQCFGTFSDDAGAHCALGYLAHTGRSWGDRRVREARERVAAYIKSNFPMPSIGSRDPFGNRYAGDEATVIIHANNTMQLTPEQFREIDRLTQIQEGMATVQALVDEVPEPALSEIGESC